MHEPKAFLKLSLDITMLFVPIRYTHTPLPSCLTFRMCHLITCLKWHHKLKVSYWVYSSLKVMRWKCS